MTFLHHVATDLRRRFGTSFQDVIIVSPNKRAGLFMEPSLLGDSNTPIWSPQFLTISELFHRLSSIRPADDLFLLSILYDIYAQCTDTEETFDAFFGWGQVLMADFDDIDKHLADAEMVFHNVRDIHELDTINYLDERQRQYIADFFRDFSDNQESRLKEKFIHIWSQLYTVYERYTSHLRAEGIGYEGMIERHVVEEVAAEETIGERLRKLARHWVFVGFNLLQPVERRLFQLVKNECDTLFYWDYDNYYMNGDHEAGESIRENIQIFGNALADDNETIYDNFLHDKHIAVIDAPSEHVLARYVTDWCNDLTDSGSSSASAANALGLVSYPPNSAIVLCNEHLLPSVIHAIPNNVGTVNMTIGYPLGDTTVGSFLNNLLLSYHHASTSGGRRLRMKYVEPVLAHPLVQQASPEAQQLLATIQRDYGLFPEREAVCINDYIALLFPVGSSAHSTSASSSVEADTANDNVNLLVELSQWLLRVTNVTASLVGNTTPVDPLQNEALFRAHTLLTRLDNLIISGHLSVSMATYEALLRQLLVQTSIPFNGEPAVGLQVMGMLETRNLDFDNLLLLSCDEQYLPQGGNDISYIPQLLRNAYGLTTYEHKESMQSYYFYRLLQRATNITLAYCSTANGLGNGEPSRFIRQLLTECPHSIRQQSLSTTVTLTPFMPARMAKSAEALKAIGSLKAFSPTGINRYLDCGRRFFYEYACNMRQPDDTTEDNIDKRTFGTLFHNVAEKVYERFEKTHTPVTRDELDKLIKAEQTLLRYIDEAISEELNGKANRSLSLLKRDSANTVPYNGTLLVIRQVLLSYIQLLLTTDKEYTPFYILGTEKEVEMPVTVKVNDNEHIVRIRGTIDRLDGYIDTDGCMQLRVIDYKTGRPDQKDSFGITDLFDHSKDGHAKGYMLQACIYSAIVRHLIDNHEIPLAELIPDSTEAQRQNVRISPALLYIRDYKEDHKDPVLQLEDMPITDITQYKEQLSEELMALFSELFDPQKAWYPISDRNQCQYCHCRPICQFDDDQALPDEEEEQEETTTE